MYPVRENGTDNLWFHPLDGSPGRRITNFHADTIQNFQFSLDGKTLGVMRTHIESDIVLLHEYRIVAAMTESQVPAVATKTFPRSGKTPTPTSPSCSKAKAECAKLQ